MKPKQIVTLVSAVILFLFLTISVFKMIVDVDARENVVVQRPISGTLVAYTTSGWKGQDFGTVQRYKKSFQYNASNPKYLKESRRDEDNSIKVRFNDGGHAQLSLSVRITMPSDPKSLLALHTTYGSQEAIERDLVGKVISNAVYMSSPLMSSKESYAERRNELINFISDQAENGVYKTSQRDIKQADPLTGEERVVTIVEYQKDSNGNFIRQAKSPLSSFGVQMNGLSILSLDYDSTVESQIKSQQALTMQVQTAIAQAKQAEQQAITTAKQGEASAAKAKWEQEAEKAKEVTIAEKNLAVQELSTKQAALYKQQQILEGEGEAEKARLLAQANQVGASQAKLEAWKFGQQVWAEAFSKYGGNVVPQIVTGGTSGQANGALQFMEIMGMKAARDLGIDMSPGK